MNKLSFEMKNVIDIAEGPEKRTYAAFYYIVDDTLLTFSNYNPADYEDVLDDESDVLNANNFDEDIKMVVLKYSFF